MHTTFPRTIGIAALVFAATANVDAHASFGVAGRGSDYGFPGIQINACAGSLGVTIGMGLDSILHRPAELSTAMRHLPFDVGIRYYFFQTPDQLFVFLNGGSVHFSASNSFTDAVYYWNKMQFASGIGLRAHMWELIQVSLGVGASYRFAPCVVTGDIVFEPPVESRFHFYLEVALGVLWNQPAAK